MTKSCNVKSLGVNAIQEKRYYKKEYYEFIIPYK